ncbi:MAG: C25 family cysteine peptidase, partial [bacterium]
QIKPEFILFVGAPNYIPWSFSSYPYGDNNYTNMDYDIYNEILSGRLTVHNITEAQTVVAKMLKYERYPDISDSLWFKKGCLIVRDIQDDDSATYRLDAQYVAGLMINNGYVKVDTFFATKGDNATSVVNATNNGRGFVLYRGAATNNWYSPFAVNPDNLTNGNKLPIVISATCGTLGTGSTSATAERWFLTGAPTTLRGTAGYFATTTSITNGAYLRSAVTRGFFDGVFLYKRRTFGEACEDGRLRVYNMYSSTNEYRGFTTIGDPAMTIWTSLPKKITVVYDSILYAGTEETLQINVQYQGTPVESAYVCIMSDSSIYKTGWTNTSGSIIFNFNSPDTGMLYITVTGRNIYPFEGISSIIYNNVYLVYDGDTISDSLNNGNGIVDPGEIILLWIKIKNCGASLAQGVKAILKTTDTMVVVSDTISYYGNIESGQTSSGLNPFVFTVSQKTPAHLIPFTVTMSDQNDSTWVTNFTIPTTGTIPGGNGTGPDPYGYYIYDDTDTLTGNAPIYEWFEIAPPGPGIIVNEITDEDADTVTYPLPFAFPYYGASYSTVGLCSNGFLELGGSTYRFGDNTSIPSTGGPRRLLAPFWDDLDPRQEPTGYGEIYYYNDTTNHRWIIEYKDCAHYGNTSTRETFQIILLDPQYYQTPTGDGEILFLYNTVANADENTVGIEDETETRGLQYVYNNNYDPDASPIVNSRALLITTKPPISQHAPWINLISYTINDSAGGNNNGIPEPNETIELIIQIKNNGDTIVSNVIGILNTLSSSVLVIDSVASFGDMDIGQVCDNSSNPYVLQVVANPLDTLVGIGIHLSGNDGNYNTTAYFTLRIHSGAGINESNSAIANGIVFRVYPNPFLEKINIRYAIPD